MKAKDLRNSILQMAVQGKLVPQDPSDEPASVLLERIRAEREKLIKEKRIKAPKGGESVIYRASDGSHYEKRGNEEPVCIDDEIPFGIPESWEWCRFETVVTIASNLVKPDGYLDLPHIAPDNIEKGTGNLLRYRTVGEDKVKSSNHLFHKGQILYSKIRPALRKAVLAPCDGLCSADMYPLSSQLDKAYLLALLLSDYFTYQTIKGDTRVKMPKTNQAALNAILVPVPPLSEQVRIGKRIVVISPLIDRCEDLENARKCLDAELPERLRKSILQMAVQGKLVPQDPADEPASALLDRIRAERAALVKAKKLKASKGDESLIYRASDGGYYEKRGKGESVCIDDEIPFEIPENWAWARLGTLFEMQAGKNIAASKISEVKDEAHPYQCYGGNGVRGYVESPNRNGRFPIVGRQGALCGCINYAEGEFYATEHAVVTTCFCETDVSWACIFLEALNLNQYATATAQPGLAVSKIVEVLIPVPPADEQSRIVNRYRRYQKLTSQ